VTGEYVVGCVWYGYVDGGYDSLLRFRLECAEVMCGLDGAELGCTGRCEVPIYAELGAEAGCIWFCFVFGESVPSE
jgi:hypothetical protein